MPVLLRLKDGVVLYAVPNTRAVVALHVTAVVPGPLHGDAVVYERLRVGRTRNIVDVHGVHNVPDVVQS